MPRISSRLRVGLVTLLVLSAALPVARARAAAWSVFTNANDLTSVAALDPYVWAPSLFGIHRFDPATGQFTQYFHEPGGLAANAINVVARDAAGTIWMGTNGQGASLLASDGTWRTVNSSLGLPSDFVTALEPFQGGMWIGTTSGLAFFAGSDLQGLWPDGVNPSPFQSNNVQDVESNSNRTWVATDNGVYTTIGGVTWDSVSTGLTNRNIRSLAHDGTVLWAVSSNGIVWSGGETGTWAPKTAGLGAAQGFRLGTRAGVLYLGASDGVHRWDGGAGNWVSLGGPTQADVDVAGDGTLWAGNGQGLWKFDGSTWTSYRSTGPGDNWIHGLTLQGSTVYFTTRYAGLARYDDARGWRNFAGVGSPSDTALYSSDYLFLCGVDREGYKWIGDWGQAVSRLDDSGPVPHFTHFFVDTTTFDAAWSFAQDSQGAIWIGLDTGCRGCPGFDPQGLLRIDPDGTRTNFLPSNSVMAGQQPRSIAFAPDGTMWVAYADNGVDLFKDRSLDTRYDHLGSTDGLNAENVWSVVFDGSSAWVVADGGVSRFSTGAGPPQFQEKVLTPAMSANGAVQPLSFDGLGGWWLATKSGLFHRRPDGTSEIFDVANSPLVSDDVHSVAVDRSTGDVWIGTGEGINRLRPSELVTATGSAGGSLLVTPNPLVSSSSGTVLVFQSGDGSPLVRTPLEIRDVAGRLVASLRTDGNGKASFRGISAAGLRLRAGVYFVRAVRYGADGKREPVAQGRLVLLP